MKITSVSQLIAEAHESLDRIATEELAKVASAVDAGNGDGELTIQIKIKRDQSGALLFEPRIKGKAPVRGAQRALLFLDADGSLVDHDPRQMAMGAIVEFAPAKRGGN